MLTFRHRDYVDPSESNPSFSQPGSILHDKSTSIVAATGKHTQIYLYRADTGEALAPLDACPGWKLLQCDFRENSVLAQVEWVGRTSEIGLFSVASADDFGRRICGLRGHKGSIYCADFAWLPSLSSSDLLASGSRDKSVRLWNLSDASCVSVLKRGHEDWVMDLTFLKELKRVASVSRDNRICFWDLAKEQLITSFVLRTSYNSQVSCLTSPTREYPYSLVCSEAQDVTLVDTRVNVYGEDSSSLFLQGMGSKAIAHPTNPFLFIFASKTNFLTLVDVRKVGTDVPLFRPGLPAGVVNQVTTGLWGSRHPSDLDVLDSKFVLLSHPSFGLRLYDCTTLREASQSRTLNLPLRRDLYGVCCIHKPTKEEELRAMMEVDEEERVRFLVEVVERQREDGGCGHCELLLRGVEFGQREVVVWCVKSVLL